MELWQAAAQIRAMNIHCITAVGAQFHPLRNKLVHDGFINETRVMLSLRQRLISFTDSECYFRVHKFSTGHCITYVGVHTLP